MATKNTSQKFSIEIEPYAFKNLLRTLGSFPKEVQQIVRDNAQILSGELKRELSIAAASGGVPPQAILVARSMLTPRDRLVRVDVGGSKKVGRKYGGVKNSRGKPSKQDSAPAGALLWGSESGSVGATMDKAGRNMGKRFVYPAKKSGYWIAPTVDKYVPDLAKAYSAMVENIIQELNLSGGV